jgi:hypothetical protein
MAFLRTASAAAIGLAAVLALPTFSLAQNESGQCILAGRLGADQQWAPRFEGVQLLGQDGRAITAHGKDALASVRQVRLAQPALLSRCDGNRELARADDEPVRPRAQAPALPAGVVDVESVAFPKLRTGGELVELKVRVAPGRVVLVSR